MGSPCLSYREVVEIAEMGDRIDLYGQNQTSYGRCSQGSPGCTFFNFVCMASSAKSFVRTQINSRYAEERFPSSEKATRISEEFELRKLSNVFRFTSVLNNAALSYSRLLHGA